MKWYVVFGAAALGLLLCADIEIAASKIVYEPAEMVVLSDGTYQLVDVVSGVGVYGLEGQALPEYLQQAVLELRLDASDTSFDKLAAIDGYLREQLCYDTTAANLNWREYPYPFTSLCLQTGEAVCSGYADAFQVLCRALGMDCWYVTGYVDKGEGELEYHAWNRVVVSDGNSYYIDVCWNDAFPGKYFLTRTLWKDHQIEAEHQNYQIRSSLFEETGQLLEVGF